MADFNNVNQSMLEQYERQYFDILKVPDARGVHRNASGNIKAAIAAKWIAEDAADGLGALERLELSRSIDDTYRSFTVIDPNG